ncbi:unnamed protein product (plasmid) [Mycetohabitans rhizoxinica HKI 454]|uniref:Uncharacterized protein n=1 Tax=Mycetohabitans rhizoxinica (strain DSM 19002 / CIP 109453 / HKI 454) TaxID=882378 RepID=E5AU01_MYCRK|nr:unnamed protein product [Mycetohabitans rhizoxinica HKI 454]
MRKPGIKVQILEFDCTVRQLLSVLQEQARASHLEWAKTIRLSLAQTLCCRRRLEEHGVIKQYEARRAAPKIGIDVVASIHVTMERGPIRHRAPFRERIVELT